MQDLRPGLPIKIEGQEAEIIKVYKMGNLCYLRAYLLNKGKIKSFCLEHVDYELQFDEEKPLNYLSASELTSAQEILSAEVLELKVQAEHLRIAHEQGDLLSISNSLVQLEPYQLDCVNKIMNKIRQRVLIADDVGLGKTIEAGLIFKELEARNRINRALFVVPAHLQKKWKKEMKKFFNIELTVADRTWVEGERKRLGEANNIWNQDAQYLIASMAFLCQPEFREPLAESFWDIVIVDECHKAAKRGSNPSRTSKRVEQIVHNSEALLLLSATPHDGKEKSFRSLISYIDPLLIAPEEELSKEIVDSVMIRRSKDMIFDEEGNRVFPDREVNTVKVEMTEKEKEFYDSVTDYVREIYNESESLNKSVVGFITTLMQKRLVSSLGAIKSTLKRRLIGLEKRKQANFSTETNLYLEGEDLEVEDKVQAERELEKVNVFYDDIEKEISTLKSLLKKAEGINLDSKAQKITNYIYSLLEENPSEKILIFTEYQDTLDYFLKLFRKEYWGDEILTIHGGVSKDKREQIEEEFNYGQSRILFATDAASEGIDLQGSCHIMINIELPWNPNRLEQRIGRLHRYGQEKEVKVWNFQYEDTKEGEVFSLLEEKLERIRDKIGNTADVLGMIGDVDISEFIMESISDHKPPSATQEEFEQIMKEREETLMEWYDKSLVGFSAFDFESRKEIKELVNESEKVFDGTMGLKSFVTRSLRYIGGEINFIGLGLFKIQLPSSNLDSDFDNLNLSQPITFNREQAMDKKDVKYISPDSSLVKLLIQKMINLAGLKKKVGIKSLSFLERAGITYIYRLSFEDGTGELLEERIIPIFVDMEIRDCNQKLGQEVIEGVNMESHLHLNRIEELIEQSDKLRVSAEEYISNKIINIRSEIKEERENKIEQELNSIKQYEKSERKRLEKFIEKYEQDKEEGKEMGISIRRQEYRLEKLEERVNQRKEKIYKKGKVVPLAPTLIGCCLSLPVS